MGVLTNFAGGKDLHFYKVVPEYIDKKSTPGFSKLPAPTFSDWLLTALQLKHIWASPNLVWSVIALAFYFLFPYDLSAGSAAAQAPLSWAFFQERFPLWATVAFSYISFWYVTLYVLNWAERPFIPNRPKNWDKLAHDVFYNISAIVIWVGFENVFAFLWATGRLPFMSDAEAFSSVRGTLRFVGGLVLVPLWRDVHFYFAHRLLHYKPVFTQVHSLHHRNTDIEPFSGLAMHPVEHLYYYACIFPSVFFYASPFHFLWNGIHLLMSPAAGHSGYEDHFQADGFHYMHHRYYEVNYAGFSAGFLDVVFGTFQEKFREKESDGPVKIRGDAKSTLRGLPSQEFVLYLALSSLCVGAWAFVALNNSAAVSGGSISVSQPLALALAVLAGAGPMAVAYIFAFVRFGAASFMEPFQKQAAWTNALHLFLGNLFCAVPVAVACYWSLL